MIRKGDPFPYETINSGLRVINSFSVYIKRFFRLLVVVLLSLLLFREIEQKIKSL